MSILLPAEHTAQVPYRRREQIERAFKGVWSPILLSSFCYGLFYLTTWPIWGSPPIGKLAFVILFTLVGIPFAYGYKKSGSFLVPWMMHFFGVLKYGMLF